MFRLVFSAFLSSTSLRPAVAWGQDGHTIIAHIAEQLLSPEVDAVLRADLNGTTLSAAATWCDEFDHTRGGSWSAPLHYLDYPGKACNFIWARDCANDVCNVGGLVNYTHQVFDKTLSAVDRLTALKFVIHLMGDLHQPLHVSSKDDEGGNLIKVAGCRFSTSSSFWDNRSASLHSVWDTTLVVQDILDQLNQTPSSRPPSYKQPSSYHDWPVLTENLLRRLAAEWKQESTEWRSAVAADRDEALFRSGLGAVANETASAGCQYAYAYPDGTAVPSGATLDRSYYLIAKPVVEKQLAKGGVRLAQVLSDALVAARRDDRVTILVV